MQFNFSALRSLPAQDEQELTAQHDAELAQLLPVLGPLFGLAVIMFSLWDFWIDPGHAVLALQVRLVAVAAGALAYWPTGITWTPVQRCGFIYVTHASAIIVCEFL